MKPSSLDLPWTGAFEARNEKLWILIVGRVRYLLSISSLLMILGSEPTEYLSAVYRREQQWIQLHASSQALHPFWHHPPITREPSAHLAVLDLFCSVIPNIIPFGSPKLVQPTLWHRDLSGSNIFISETELTQGRISITSVIDWQNTSVGPFVHARMCSASLWLSRSMEFAQNARDRCFARRYRRYESGCAKSRQRRGCREEHGDILQSCGHAPCSLLLPCID